MFQRPLRLVIPAFLLLGLATAVLFGKMEISTNEVELITQDLKLPNLPAEFEHYRIAFLSDLHFTPCLPTKPIEQALTIVKKENPDIVLLGGDLIWIPDGQLNKLALSMWRSENCPQVDASFQDYKDAGRRACAELSTMLAQLDAPDGIFTVFGNHDYWVNPQDCQEELAQTGIRVLHNEQISIDRGLKRITVTGLEDYWSSIPKLPERLSAARTNILLTHNPDLIAELLGGTAAKFDLALAGHTHGGQIRLPFIGALHYNISTPMLAEGLIRTEAGYVYTSRGIGTILLPIRLNCRPEVAVFSLHQQKTQH